MKRPAAIASMADRRVQRGQPFSSVSEIWVVQMQTEPVCVCVYLELFFSSSRFMLSSLAYGEKKDEREREREETGGQALEKDNQSLLTTLHLSTLVSPYITRWGSAPISYR